MKTILPFNWCDRQCERCPLATTCPIPAKGIDPVGDALDEVAASLDEALALVRADAEAEGIDLDDLPPPPAPSIEALDLDEAAFVMFSAMRTDEHVTLAMLAAAKIHRITSLPDDDELFADDTVPNLLLIEHVLDALPVVVEVARVRGLLAPWFARIPDEARAVLAALIRAERAPSPWCRVPDRSRVRATPPRTA